MKSCWKSKSLASSLGAGALTVLGLVGCGGKSSTDDAVVYTDPSANLSKAGAGAPAASAPAATTTAAPAATTPAPAASSSAPAAAAPAGGWGTLKGKVVFGGAAEPPRDLVKKGDAGVKDPAVCAVETIKSERLVVDGATKGVKNAIVYLALPKGAAVNEEAKSAKASTPVVFDQKNCVFVPHVIAVMKDSTIQLKSSDAVGHNINSKVRDNQFNTAVPANGTGTYKVEAASRVPGSVVCDIHSWMKAFWLVLDHPYFAVTDDKGNFEIKNAPAGTHKVVVWQEAANFVTPASGQEITIKASADNTQDFTIDPAKLVPEQ